MYKLFTDKAETFECDIKIEGASLTNSKARLVIETKDYSLLFNGKINSSGKCTIPVKKLKGLIDESSKGDIRLEVIAEDTYFTPWESKFEIEASKKVTVEVKSQNTKPLLKTCLLKNVLIFFHHIHFVIMYLMFSYLQSQPLIMVDHEYQFVLISFFD